MEALGRKRDRTRFKESLGSRPSPRRIMQEQHRVNAAVVGAAYGRYLVAQ